MSGKAIRRLNTNEINSISGGFSSYIYAQSDGAHFASYDSFLTSKSAAVTGDHKIGGKFTLGRQLFNWAINALVS